MIATIPLTEEQRRSMRSESAWLQLTPAQNDFIAATGPDETCTLYGDAFLRVPTSTLTDLMGEAWRTATLSALQQLGLTHADEWTLQSFPPDLGGTYVRVTVTGADGRTASAQAQIPDPRAVH